MTERCAPRPARAGQHAAGDVGREPHVAGHARQVDSREPARQSRRRCRRRTCRRSTRRPEAAKATSVRERMEQHRANPACAACHKIMDPIGFALENFDVDRPMAHARRRRRRSMRPGSWWTARRSTARSSLRKALLAARTRSSRTMTEKLLMYGVGRETEVLRHAGRPRDHARRGAERLPVLVDSCSAS